jgi:hypothetical protein
VGYFLTVSFSNNILHHGVRKHYKSGLVVFIFNVTLREGQNKLLCIIFDTSDMNGVMILALSG